MKVVYSPFAIQNDPYSFQRLVFAEFLRVSELLSTKRRDIIFESYYESIFIPKSKIDIYRDGNTDK
jgi:integrase